MAKAQFGKPGSGVAGYLLKPDGSGDPVERFAILHRPHMATPDAEKSPHMVVKYRAYENPEGGFPKWQATAAGARFRTRADAEGVLRKYHPDVPIHAEDEGDPHGEEMTPDHLIEHGFPDPLKQNVDFDAEADLGRSNEVTPEDMMPLRRVKLARGDHEEQAFQAHMAAHPEDHNHKLVYADWLQEHGEDQIAQRLRWWAKLQAHLDANPHKLARVNGPAGAVAQGGSTNHETRLGVARAILKEAGLPALVRAVMTRDSNQGVRAAVSAVMKEANPKLARYAAAWMGLLTGERKMTVFHPGDGQDILHVIDSPHPPEHVGEYLSRAGVPQFSMEKKGKGTRAYVVSPMDLIDVQTAANGLGGTHKSMRGTATRLGTSEDSDASARAAFRQVIDDTQREAGL